MVVFRRSHRRRSAAGVQRAVSGAGFGELGLVKVEHLVYLGSLRVDSTGDAAVPEVEFVRDRGTSEIEGDVGSVVELGAGCPDGSGDGRVVQV